MNQNADIGSEAELVRFLKSLPEYKDLIETQLAAKISREERAWELIKEDRGNYSIENLNIIFDTVDIGPRKGRWFGALIAQPNRALIFANPVEIINDWIEHLLFKSKPVEQALNHCLGELRLKGASAGLATLLLYLKDPKTYSIWLPATQAGLICLGRMKKNEILQNGPGYLSFNSIAIKFRDEYEIDPRGLDWYLAFIGKRFQKEGNRYVLRNKMVIDDEFETLFQEFVTEFLQQTVGQEHLSNYERNRAQGKANYKAIENLAKQGQWTEELTGAVLRTLLPHSESVSNRERNAWIHVAPSFSGDARVKFENIGWAKPEDWSEIAQALFRFFKRCQQGPDQFATASAEFEASGRARGFQTGALTPMLNSLRPDDYWIVNSKPLRVVNYFCKTNFRQTLMDYPAVNSALKELSEKRKGLFDQVLPTGIRPSDLLDAYSHWLVAVRKFKFGGGTGIRYWKIAPGASAWNWEQWRNEGIVTIGWDTLGDLSNVTREEFDSRRDQALKAHPEWNKVGLEQVWKFAKEIREGDRVVANQGTKAVLGIGTVAGSYVFVLGGRHGHRIQVEWDDTSRRTVNENGWKRTLIELDREKFESIIELHAEHPPKQPAAIASGALPSLESIDDQMEDNPNPEYTMSTCALDTGLDEGTLVRWVRAIERKGQAILYGPPGTGKTYISERLARHLISGGDGFLELVQFHPSYAYEDFIQGIRPRTRENGAIEYPLVPGRFLDFCRKARRRKDRCILIVDEINRANLSRVFGELMYLLENRGCQIPLAGGEPFFIPPNVRLIGTMNTADRSIALVDYALRRRFAFLELSPKYEILEKYHKGSPYDVQGLVEFLKKVNQQIGDNHYYVGISFFLRHDLKDQIEDIWRMEIVPYLEEYFLDQPARVDEFRWEKVKEKVLGS